MTTGAEKKADSLKNQRVCKESPFFLCTVFKQLKHHRLYHCYLCLQSIEQLQTPTMESISQLIRFARASSYVADFNTRNKLLTQKLLKQGYRYHKLRKTFQNFIDDTMI